jgi:hypothetical protein
MNLHSTHPLESKFLFFVGNNLEIIFKNIPFGADLGRGDWGHPNRLKT